MEDQEYQRNPSTTTERISHDQFSSKEAKRGRAKLRNAPYKKSIYDLLPKYRFLYKKYLSVTGPDFFYLYWNRYKKDDVAPLAKDDYLRALYQLMFRLNEAMIYKRQFLRIPGGLRGVLYVKRQAGAKRAAKYKIKKYLTYNGDVFKFKWERRKWLMRKPLTRIRHANLYTYNAYRDKNAYIGNEGLNAEVKRCAEDPYKKPYDAIKKIPYL